MNLNKQEFLMVLIALKSLKNRKEKRMEKLLLKFPDHEVGNIQDELKLINSTIQKLDMTIFLTTKKPD